MMGTVTRIRALVIDAKPAWLCIGGLLSAWLLAAIPHNPDPAKRVLYAGVYLQAAGFLFVARGLAETRRMFGITPLWQRITGYCDRCANFVRGRRKGVTGTLSLQLDPITFEAHAIVLNAACPNASAEERLVALQENFRILQMDTDRRLVGVANEVRKLRADFERDQNARSADHSALASRLTVFAVGDFDYQVIGLVWLCLSTVATSMPSDVVWLFRLVEVTLMT